jgi:hypothetical protein
MGLIQILLWKWRIERGIAEVQRLAIQHPGDIAYRITTAQSALSIFLELPSLEKSLLKTSDAEGEEI